MIYRFLFLLPLSFLAAAQLKSESQGWCTSWQWPWPLSSKGAYHHWPQQALWTWAMEARFVP